MLDISKEHIRVALQDCDNMQHVFFVLCGEDSWMFYISICVRCVADLYDGELRHLIMGHMETGVLCSFIKVDVMVFPLLFL
jgi:hypothetical protein